MRSRLKRIADGHPRLALLTIAGIALGGIVGMCLVVGLLVYLR